MAKHIEGSWCVCGHISLKHAKGGHTCLDKTCPCCRFRYDKNRLDQPRVEKVMFSDLNHNGKKIGRPATPRHPAGERRYLLFQKYGVKNAHS